MSEEAVTPAMVAEGVRILADVEGLIGHTAAASIAEDVFRAMLARAWRPIETAPEGTPILLYWPLGERGNGGFEVAVILRHDSHSPTDMSFWTHGGPNAGLDWEPRNSEIPTHWMPLPEPPQ